MHREAEAKVPNTEIADYVEQVHGIEIAPHTWNQMRWRGTGPAFYRIAGRIYYAPEDVAGWIESHRYEKSAEWRAEEEGIAS